MRYNASEPRNSSGKRIPQAMRDQANRRMGGSGSVLSKLFGKMVCDMGYENLSKWNTLMHKYLTDRRNAIPQNKKDLSSARGNLHKELMKGHMSWNVFVKGMRFLDLKGYEIIVYGHHRDGSVTMHSETVGLGDRIEYSEAQSVPDIEVMPGDSITIVAHQKNGPKQTHSVMCVTDDVVDLDSEQTEDSLNPDLESLSVIFSDPELAGFEPIKR